MPKWKKCPNCGGHIPESWNRHEKCGWNVGEKEEVKKNELVEDMEKAIVDSFDVMKRIKQKYPEEYIQLDPTKIALTLFIQNRREKQISNTLK
ncbi:MAG: hypothetical protein QXS37_02635 [Candidatus Aenigmatarchaeota archaeon]